MEHGPLNNFDFFNQQKKMLLELAARSIDEGLDVDRPYNPEGEYEGALSEKGASFVTLTIDGQLRGCIGTIDAWRPLVNDVAENAFNAAFRDPRFSPLMASERNDLEIHISILTPPVAFKVKSREELVLGLRPGIDGLVLHAGNKRATFLPSVWEGLPQPERFFSELLRKAGLPVDYWSDRMTFERYQVIEID